MLMKSPIALTMRGHEGNEASQSRLRYLGESSGDCLYAPY